MEGGKGEEASPADHQVGDPPFLTNKNETQKFIRYFGREKFEDTMPEQMWDVFAYWAWGAAEWNGQNLRPPKLETNGVTLSPDRSLVIPLGNSYVELDGEQVHGTPRQESKTRWRDSLIVASNHRVIHVDAELVLHQRWWAHLAGVVEQFLGGGKSVGHAYA